MNDFFNSLLSTKMGPGVLVTITGMLGVFAVLILFYLIILLLNRVFPYKPEA